MRRAVYPGSFDPVTNGHMDIIMRASRQFDEVVVAVLNNSSKSPLFSIDERVNILKKVTSNMENVTVRSFAGLTVDVARECGANTIVRGLRATTDFEYELQLAQMNYAMDSSIDTMCFITNLKYAYVSSSTVKEVAMFGGDVYGFVPEYVAERLYERFQNGK